MQVTNNVPKVDCSEATSVPVIMKQGQPEYDIEVFQKFRGVFPVMLVLTCLHCGSPATLSLFTYIVAHMHLSLGVQRGGHLHSSRYTSHAIVQPPMFSPPRFRYATTKLASSR